jgi:hypothetical protein
VAPHFSQPKRPCSSRCDAEVAKEAISNYFAVMKCVIPESPFTWPRGHVDARSWDAALDVVQQSLLGMAAGDDVTDEEDRVLTAVFMECEDLRAKNYLKIATTNRELAKKYGVGRRTITNWRKEGCPFENGQWQVLDWLAGRRYAPAGAKERFAKQLSDRRDEAVATAMMAELNFHVLKARQLKAAYQAQGLKPPDWLRGFRARR